MTELICIFMSYPYLNLWTFYCGHVNFFFFFCHSHRILRFDLKVVVLYFVSDSKIAPKRNYIRFHDILNQKKKKTVTMYRYLEKIIRYLDLYHDKFYYEVNWNNALFGFTVQLLCAQSHDWSSLLCYMYWKNFPSIFFYIVWQGNVPW